MHKEMENKDTKGKYVLQVKDVDGNNVTGDTTLIEKSPNYIQGVLKKRTARFC